MSKLLANQIANYNDNGPVEVKEGITVPSGKPFQIAGAAGNAGDYLKSTGSTIEWTTFPSIPSAQVNSDWTATSGVAQILNRPTLATVATSGSYVDLSNKPTIPSAQVQTDWTQANPNAVDYIQNKPTLFSGNYADLTGKPTIPANLADLTNVHNASPSDGQVLKWINANSRWEPAIDAAGTDTTYSQSSVADGSNIKLRLTDSGLTNDDILITAGNNITISSVTPGGFTIAATDTDTDTFIGLSDTPSSFTANKWLKVNAGGTALEYTNAPAGGGATVTTDDNAPSSPNDGDLWWKSDEGRLKVYYADGSSDQWVDAFPLQTAPSSIANTTTNGTHALTTTSTISGSNVNAIEIQTDNGTASAVRWRFTPPGHFIPNVNAAYDIGNAEYKVRHLFLSDNTLYFEGDFLKVAQHNEVGTAQAPSYLIPLSKLKDALNASGDYEAFKTAILAITDA